MQDIPYSARTDHKASNLSFIERYKGRKTLSEEEFILEDRLAKIRAVVREYGEDNFYIAFSGGKDSTVIHELFDLALPGNRIPRCYIDTGIDLNMIRDFAYNKAKQDDRFVTVQPKIPIIPMLKQEGYPFKSKPYAHNVERYNRIGMVPSVEKYLNKGKGQFACPKMLRYQFTPQFRERLKVSDKCCVKLKEEPIREWARENGRTISVIGIIREEGGRRNNAQCLVLTRDKVTAFQPLSVISKEWEEWFIKEHNIEICPIYLPPYSLPRSGCKGCPFALGLQDELDMLEKYFPEERKQAELIWQPVYAEYRRLGYRLKNKEKEQDADIFEMFETCA